MTRGLAGRRCATGGSPLPASDGASRYVMVCASATAGAAVAVTRAPAAAAADRRKNVRRSELLPIAASLLRVLGCFGLSPAGFYPSFPSREPARRDSGGGMLVR